MNGTNRAGKKCGSGHRFWATRSFTRSPPGAPPFGHEIRAIPVQLGLGLALSRPQHLPRRSCNCARRLLGQRTSSNCLLYPRLEFRDYACMIFGVSATKTAIVVAETKGTGNKFAITAIKPIPFEVRSGGDLAELLRCLATIFDRRGLGPKPTIALLKCSS